MFVIVGMSTDAHSLRSQVDVGSESDCCWSSLTESCGYLIQKQE